MKSTARAPANIAFIKYWGKKDSRLRLPLNSSLSMNLGSAYTTTTVESSERLKEDAVSMVDAQISLSEIGRMRNHIDFIRNTFHQAHHVKVVTKNSFPKSTGLASSASGFAALTVAACTALDLHISEKELTILARLGSGSACRSIPDGYVLWEEGNSTETSFAHSLYPASYWRLHDIIAVVDNTSKDVSTAEGMSTMKTSPFWKTRIDSIPRRLAVVKDALKKKNIKALGEMIEAECLNMHAVMMTQEPPLVYLSGKTVECIKSVWQWRKDGLPVYFTIDAGPNVHLICEEPVADEVQKRALSISGVKQVINNSVSGGTQRISDHLF